MNRPLHLLAIFVASLSLISGTTSSSSRSSSSSSSRSSSGWSSSSASRSSSGWSSSSAKPSSSSGWSSSSAKPASPGWSSSSAKPSVNGSASTKPTVNGTASTKPPSTTFSKANQSSALAPMKSKTDFISDFKAQNAAKYTNKFSTEPSTRPSYIPQQTTTSSGVQVPLVFNTGVGGYGHYMGTTWVPYDPLVLAADTAFYSYAAPYVTPAPSQVVVRSTSYSVIAVSLILLVVGVVVLIKLTS